MVAAAGERHGKREVPLRGGISGAEWGRRDNHDYLEP